MSQLIARARRTAAGMLCALGIVTQPANAQTSPQLAADLSSTKLTSVGVTHSLALRPDVTVFFARTDPDSSRQLWRTDGTVAGTHPIPLSGQPTIGPISGSFISLGQRALFRTSQVGLGSSSTTIWGTDGTTAGTKPLITLPPESGQQMTSSQINAGRFFFTRQGDQSYLAVTDGTSGGTRETSVGSSNANATIVATTSSSALMRTTTSPFVVVSDGTEAGTHAIAPVPAIQGVDSAGAWFGGALPGGFLVSRGDSPPPLGAGSTLRVIHFVSETGATQLLRSSTMVHIGPTTSLNGAGYYFERTTNMLSLVRTDGTATGTEVVTTLPAFASGGQRYETAAIQLWSLNGRMIFINRRDASTIELFSSDGTASGTILLNSFPNVPVTTFPTADSGVLDSAVVGDRVLFINRRATNQFEIIASDGTPFGTASIAVIPGTNARVRFERPPVLAGARLAFDTLRTPIGPGSVLTRDTWLSGGTPDTTVMITPPTGSRRANRSPVTVAGGDVFVTHTTRSSGGEARSTLSVLNEANAFVPRDTSASPVLEYGWMRVHGSIADRLMYSVPGEQAGNQLRTTTASTPADITPLEVLQHATDSTDIVHMADTRDGLLVWLNTPTGELQLWRTVPSSPPTLVRAWPKGTSLFLSSRYTLQISGRVMFALTTPDAGTEPWATDGTTAGTAIIADVVAGSGSSNPQLIGELNGEFVFSVRTANFQYALYASTGEVGNLRLIASNLGLQPGLNTSAAGNGVLYFAGITSVTQPFVGQIFQTDGTGPGTLAATNLSGSGWYSNLRFLNGRLYFTSFFNPFGLYALVDTPERQVRLSPSPAPQFYGPPTLLGSEVVVSFQAPFFPSGTTPSEIQVIRGLNAPETLFSLPRTWFWADEALSFDGKLFIPVFTQPVTLRQLLVVDPSHTEAWYLDGQLSEAKPNQMRVASNRLYFEATTPSTGAEPWVSDGSLAHTRLLGDINPGPASSYPSQFIGSGGKTYFSAYSVATGEELYVVDACRADFNADGARTVDDVFDYINAWFRNSPRAGGAAGEGAALTIDDIFVFINTWFAGCA